MLYTTSCATESMGRRAASVQFLSLGQTEQRRETGRKEHARVKLQALRHPEAL